MATVALSQRVGPNDFSDQGASWEDLAASVAISGSTLVVRLSNLADGIVIADAIRVERIGSLTGSSAQSGDSVAAADRALAELAYGSYRSAEVRAYRIKSTAGSRQLGPDWDLLDTHMDKAMKIAYEQKRMPELAICQLRRAEMLVLRGAHGRAISSLAQAEVALAAMSMPWWLDEARKLREHMGGR